MLSHIVDISKATTENALLYIKFEDYGISGSNQQFQKLFRYFKIESFKQAKAYKTTFPTKPVIKIPYHKAWPFFWCIRKPFYLSKANLALFRF